MKRFSKAISSVIAVIIALAVVCPSAFAREFAPTIDTSNIGVNTQYKYDEADPSWLRQLTIKEDMLSSSGLINEEEREKIAVLNMETFSPELAKVYL